LKSPCFRISNFTACATSVHDPEGGLRQESSAERVIGLFSRRDVAATGELAIAAAWHSDIDEPIARGIVSRCACINQIGEVRRELM